MILTKVGDVLILRTSATFTMFAVGVVRVDGQQGIEGQLDVKHLPDRESALVAARALVRTGGQIYLVDIDQDSQNNWQAI